MKHSSEKKKINQKKKINLFHSHPFPNLPHILHMETQSRILVEVFLLTQKTNWHDDLSSFLSLLEPLSLIPQNVSNSTSVEKKRSRFAQNESKGNQDPKSSSISASHTFLQPLLLSNPSRSKQERLSHEQVWRHRERHWWLGPAIALRRKRCKRKKRDWLYGGKYTEMLLILTQIRTSCWPWDRSFSPLCDLISFSGQWQIWRSQSLSCPWSWAFCGLAHDHRSHSAD